MARGRSRTEEDHGLSPLRTDFRGAELMSGKWEKGTEFDPTRYLGPDSPLGDMRSCGTMACSADSHRLSWWVGCAMVRGREMDTKVHVSRGRGCGLW